MPPKGAQGDRGGLIALTLALEEALAREAWDEADDLFAARERVYSAIPAHAVPHEVDDIDARILARLERGQAEIRREILALNTNQRASAAYGNSSARTSLFAA